MYTSLFSIYISMCLFVCFGLTPSRNSIRFTPGMLARINVHIYEMPKDTDNYEFLMINSNNEVSATYTGKIYEMSNNDQWVGHVDFSHNLKKNDDKSSLLLELKQRPNNTCSGKTVAVFHKVDYDAETSDRCLSSGCTEVIKWNKVCNMPNEPSNTRIVKAEDETNDAHENILEKYQHGSRFKYKCENNEEDHNYILAWRQLVGKNGLQSQTAYSRNDLTLDLTLTKFDNGTSFTCYLECKSNCQVKNIKIYEIKFIWDGNIKLNRYTYDDHMVDDKTYVSWYNESDYRDLYCKGKLCNWYRIKNNKIDVSFPSHAILEKNQLKLPLHLNRDDHGASFVCICYNMGAASHTLVRHVSRMYKFLMEGLPENEHEYNTEDNFIEEDLSISYPDGLSMGVVAGFVAAGIFLPILVGVATWKFCLKTSRVQPNLEVDTYAVPNVRYVAIETGPTSNRDLKKNDTPYAEIIGVLEHVQ